MDERLAKDLAFFHDHFAGSLTKRTLGYARRFEDVFDVLAFQVIAKILPLGFVTVVLWRYSPLLILVLLGMLSITVALVVPRIRRRRQLVDEREAASNVLAGHVADSIANAEAVRAFARERDEAAIHADNVREFGRKTLRSWDYQNFRVNLITAPMYVLKNTLGLIVALHTSLGTAASLETVFLTFSYFESFPWWAVAFWAVSVFGGVIGCFLLLLENRLAFRGLLASLIGAIVVNLGGLFLLGGMEVMRETGGLGFTAFPIVVAALLAYYARAMSKNRVLS